MSSTAPTQGLPFPLWLGKVFFTWQGTVTRKEYLGGLACLVLLTMFYSFAVYLAYFLFVAPPGGELTPEFIFRAQRAQVLPNLVLLPMVAMNICMDAKRLRSFRAWPLLAVPVNALMLLSLPAENTLVANVVSMGTLMYRCCLLLVPASVWTVGRLKGSGGAVKIYDWRLKGAAKSTRPNVPQERDS